MIINSDTDIIVTINDEILTFGEDYTIEDNSIIFTNPPEANDEIKILKREDDKTNN
jgi:hypothetical protein